MNILYILYYLCCQLLTYAAIERLSNRRVVVLVLATTTAHSFARRFLWLDNELSAIPKMHPEEVYCRSRTRYSVTHLPRNLNTSSWACDDDRYRCQRGLLPTKCLVWQARCQLIKSHARTVTVREKQGVLFSWPPPLPLALLASRHW